MSVNLHQLDQIKDYDQAIAMLEKFVDELVLEFVDSIEAQTYLQGNPAINEYVGSWIDNLLYFGYAYESVTLPQMTISNVEVIVTKIFPSKISLLNSSEANSAIPELIAFWQFLKREYQHPQAHKIVKFLKQLQPKFPSLMNNPTNFGIAKSFLMSGMAAGFDLTTEAGMQKWQQQHNQGLAPVNSNKNDSFPNIPELLTNLRIADGESPSQVAPEQLEQMVQELVTEILAEFEEEVPSAQEFQQQLQANITSKSRQLVPEISPNKSHFSSQAIGQPSRSAIAILQDQEITQTTPGTILQDFQTLLDFVGSAGIEVSGKRNLIPLKSLIKINQQLAEPIQTNLQRPQQKSYPTINGLYLLLRATGMTKIVQAGKQTKLELDAVMLNSWQQMNLTERYLNLLEAWLIVAHGEMLGEERSSMSEGSRCFQYWSRIPPQGEKFPNYQLQENLKYYPGFHNLALMKLFGLVQASYGKPLPSKGWRVKSVKQTTWGQALLQAAFDGWIAPEMLWDDEPIIPQFGKLQPVLQPYFPQWQKILELPKIEAKSGVYIFKVSWQQIWRRIAISSEMTLWDLSQLILQSVDFDSDHLDMFSYKNQLGQTMRIVHPYLEEPPTTDKVKIVDLPLSVGCVLEYLFDFGDNWEFQLQLEEIKPEHHSGYGEIIASEGKAPEQYPDWEEDYE